MTAQNNTLMRINRILETKHWTVYRLAKEADIPYSSLSNLFQRNTEPTLPTLRRICGGLGISLSEFFSDESTPESYEYTKTERELIDLYQSLKQPDKLRLTAYAQGLAKHLPEYD